MLAIPFSLCPKRTIAKLQRGRCLLDTLRLLVLKCPLALTTNVTTMFAMFLPTTLLNAPSAFRVVLSITSRGFQCTTRLLLKQKKLVFVPRSRQPSTPLLQPPPSYPMSTSSKNSFEREATTCSTRALRSQTSQTRPKKEREKKKKRARGSSARSSRHNKL